MNKKLQVFVSSTYTDLIEERQAAVEAILDTGNIPAGMELFKAGNESQLKTIYKWIDESDVYMLILGGRYGSIESGSGKSYTQLEYEYALSKNIPVFSIVLSDSFLKNKINIALNIKDIMEQDAPDEYKKFKSFVMTKVIKHADDCKDIKIVIHSTLNEFINEYDLAGWSRNSTENDVVQLLKDNNILIKENLALSKQIQKLKEQLNSKNKEQLGGFSFDDLVKIFEKKSFKLPKNFVDSDDDITVTALNLFVFYYNDFCIGATSNSDSNQMEDHMFSAVCPYYVSFGVMEIIKLGAQVQRIQTTKYGSQFYAWMEYKNLTSQHAL